MFAEVRHTSSPTAPARDGHEGKPRVDVRREPTAEQRIGRAAVIGAAVGVAITVPGVFVIALIAGAGAGAAICVALFCSLWGGLGLGAMEGAVAEFGRQERREAAATRQGLRAVDAVRE